jgi:hypothetical protein
MLADIQVLLILFRQLNLLIVEFQFQVRDLGIVEILCRYLSPKDGRLCEISTFDTKLDLFEDKLGLFPPIHGSEGLNLELAQNIGGASKVASFLPDGRKNTGYTGSLNFDKDLGLHISCYIINEVCMYH